MSRGWRYEQCRGGASEATLTPGPVSVSRVRLRGSVPSSSTLVRRRSVRPCKTRAGAAIQPRGGAQRRSGPALPVLYVLRQKNGGGSCYIARASCPPSRARGRPLQFDATRRLLGRTAPPRPHGGPPGRGAQRQKIAPAERPRAPTATGEAKRAPCRRRKGARGRLLRRLRSANKLRNRRPPALHRRAVRPDCVPVYLCVCVCVCLGRIRGSALVI